MAKKRRSKDDLKEIDVLVERLREFSRIQIDLFGLKSGAKPDT
jgi:hypothetical protein